MIKSGHTLSALDWLVIAGYGAGMLAIGAYYSRRNTSTEEYLLGGRKMKSWTVGLSLFATLLSTISYLAYPGEVIKYGPMYLSGLIAYPFIFLVVGWLLVPFFTKLRVTSAHEILEMRLGLGARMLASFFFLSLRLLWMAMIVFTTTSVVLMPVLGLDPKYTWLVSAVVGLVTVVYTGIGGLRAVVLTDVVQTFILFLGAIVALVLINHSLGGTRAWLPKQWDPAWGEARIGFDSTDRITLANSVLGWFLWYVCTYGSDQLVIQRYLSTRDVKAARRVMLFSLGADVLVSGLLALLGFALLAYSRHHPDQFVGASSDQLFTHYIMSGLPTGLSGLVIAGLLAAAMSSLSAGINAASSVIAVDFLGRFGESGGTAHPDVNQVRRISFAIGVIVVALSLLFQHVSGNLVEVAGKVVNLFVVPLFILFFMALFVPWARQFGAMLAAMASIAVGAAIAFYQIFDLKFLWIMPCSLVTGIVVGALASLIPTSRMARERVADLRAAEPATTS